MTSERGPFSDLRDAIDAIDDEILDLLNRRAGLAAQIAARKQADGGVFYVPARERAIIDRLQARNPGPFPVDAIRPVFQEVISACLSLEKAVRVSYLGPEASFTHQAVKRHFGTSADTVPCGTISAVFAEVDRAEADFGVVPVENSTEGVVNHTLDSFIDTRLRISAEIVVDVDHCLLARPGTDVPEIARVYSHPQALAQCRKWLEANLKRATLVETASTSDAARSAQGDPTGAAIGAELAARMYGLAVLRRQIQDAPENVTRFLVVTAREQEPPVAGGQYKTSIVVATPDQPGVLFRVLEPLSRSGINLTKIESRPTRARAWHYVFFLDLDGHCSDAPVAGALAELGGICELVKVLGSYRKADTI
jgi:chorismate mutase/prephenate dehydratase